MANRAIDLAGEQESWLELTAPLREALEATVRRFQDRGEVDPELVPEDTAATLTDLLEHSARGAVVFKRESLVADVKRILLRGTRGAVGIGARGPVGR